MSWQERRVSVWQAEGGLTAAVLFEVFSWLGGAELARAGAACRAWRAAAADPALWRRLLLPHVAQPLWEHKQHDKTLAPLYETQGWRSEYVLAHAEWELRARLAAGRAPLQHAALSSCGTRLALATEDAAVLIWERTEEELWREMWSRSVRARGWESVARSEWPRGDKARLLIAGPLAVAHRWELIVLQQQDNESEWCVVSRAGCSAGAAGCWAGADAFLALELRRLAAAHYATTVWLNAATQETQSEYAGVTTPLLRVYNEEKATITHVLVAGVPLDYTDDNQRLLTDETSSDSSQNERPSTQSTLQTLVCGFSGASGVLRAWGLSALQPPPLLAAGDLRARADARRAAAAAAADAGPDAEPPEPDEQTVRALCTPHEYECRLPAALVGLVVQPDGRAAWACTAGAGATCVSLPTMRALRRLQPPAAAGLNDLHYVHPAISDCYFVAPSGARSGDVCVWSVRSGAPRPAPLAHAAPALAAALPPRRAPRLRRTLLVLAADQIYSRGRRATPHTHATAQQARANMALRIAHGAFACVRSELGARPARLLASRSCQRDEPPPCAPCPPQPRPPCRATPPTTLRATRRVCCPPPAGSPPPCPPPPCAPHLTCEAAGSQKRGSKRICLTSEGCGTDRDRVARRLSLAERERRLDYEREVAARPVPYASEPPPAPYTLGAERECARATDGKSYAVKCERAPPAPCGPGRAPPPPRCVELVRDTECTIRNNAHLDPCAHVPRTIIDIDRSADRSDSTPAAPAFPMTPAPVSASRASACPESTSPGQSPTKNLTSRIMERLSLTRNSVGASCPKRSEEPKCETTGARRAGDTGWCQTQPKPSPVPPCCREPTTMEKIKRRGPGHCSREKGGPSGRRTFHSSACSRATASAAGGDRKKGPDASVSTAKGTADAESLKKVLKERESLLEAGRGRVVTDMSNKPTQNTTSGRLDIPIPVGAQNIRVRVSLDGTKACCKANSEPKTATVKCSASNDVAPKSDKNQSWLSLKSLQQKLAGCRKKDSLQLIKDKKIDGGRTPATCPRPQPPKLKSPAPLNPCATPATPRGNPCGTPTPPKPTNPCGAPTSPKPTNPCGAPTPPKPTNPCGTPTPPKPTNPCGAPTPPKPTNPCGAPPPPKPTNPCKAPTPPKPTNPCGAPPPPKPTNPCGSPTPPKSTNPCGSPSPAAPRNPCAAPSASTGTKKPTRYSANDSDSLIPETLFIQW